MGWYRRRRKKWSVSPAAIFFLNSISTQVLLVTLGSLTQAIKSEINFFDTHTYEYTHSIQTPLSTEVALTFKWPWHEAP